MKEDSLLWDRLRTGDEKALKRLFEKYYSRLCDFSTFYTKNVAISKEIVSDAFFKLWEKRDSIFINTSLKAYLFTMVRNYSLNYVNKARPNLVPLDNCSENIREPQQDAEELLLFTEFEDLIFEEIEKLPERQKEVFKLSRIYGMSYQEISAVLCISVNTVQEHMVNAMKKMAKWLKQYTLLK